jgi:hypothetical protein
LASTPSYFTHISITKPIVFTLKSYYIQSSLEVPTEFLNHFWIQVAVPFLKPPHGGSEVKRPLRMAGLGTDDQKSAAHATTNHAHRNRRLQNLH